MCIFRNKKEGEILYRILLKMKNKFGYEAWLTMIEQAKEKGKLSEKEYKKLLENE